MVRTYQAEKSYQTARNQTFKNLSNGSALSTRKNLSGCPNQISKNLSKPKTFQAAKTLNLKAFSKTDCVSSGDKYWR